jgi:hypothetical protein
VALEAAWKTDSGYGAKVIALMIRTESNFKAICPTRAAGHLAAP